jgi:hypothetical protein
LDLATREISNSKVNSYEMDSKLKYRMSEVELLTKEIRELQVNMLEEKKITNKSLEKTKNLEVMLS